MIPPVLAAVALALMPPSVALRWEGAGDSFRLFWSPDGSRWTRVATVSRPRWRGILPMPCLLRVTAHTASGGSPPSHVTRADVLRLEASSDLGSWETVSAYVVEVPPGRAFWRLSRD